MEITSSAWPVARSDAGTLAAINAMAALQNIPKVMPCSVCSAMSSQGTRTVATASHRSALATKAAASSASRREAGGEAVEPEQHQHLGDDADRVAERPRRRAAGRARAGRCRSRCCRAPCTPSAARRRAAAGAAAARPQQRLHLGETRADGVLARAAQPQRSDEGAAERQPHRHGGERARAAGVADAQHRATAITAAATKPTDPHRRSRP